MTSTISSESCSAWIWRMASARRRSHRTSVSCGRCLPNPIHHDHGDVIGEVGAGPLARAVDERREKPIRWLRQPNRQYIAKLTVAEEFTIISRRLSDAVRVEHEAI